MFYEMDRAAGAGCFFIFFYIGGVRQVIRLLEYGKCNLPYDFDAPFCSSGASCDRLLVPMRQVRQVMQQVLDPNATGATGHATGSGPRCDRCDRSCNRLRTPMRQVIRLLEYGKCNLRYDFDAPFCSSGASCDRLLIPMRQVRQVMQQVTGSDATGGYAILRMPVPPCRSKCRCR